MLTTRRELIVYAAVGLAPRSLKLAPEVLAVSSTTGRTNIKALAFDAFAIFDPRSVFALADTMFPGSGLSDEWRTRQFEYTWLRVAAQHYVDFWTVTGDALVFATNRLKLRLSPDNRAILMNAYLELRPWPDAVQALDSLKKSNLRLAFLSNFTQHMLDANIKHAGLDGRFEHVLSTDQRNTFKPDPHAYQLGLDAFRLTREEVLFVPFAGWDAAGARLFGYPTYWINRQHDPAEEMGVAVEDVGGTFIDLMNFMA